MNTSRARNKEDKVKIYSEFITSDKALLLFYIIIILLYFFLIKQSYKIIVHLDLFEQSKIPKENFLKWSLSIETATWLMSYMIPLMYVWILLLLSKIYKAGLNLRYEEVFKFVIIEVSDILIFIILGAFILRWYWGKEPDLKGDLKYLLAIIAQYYAYAGLAFLVYAISRDFWKGLIGSFIYFLVEMYVRNMLFDIGISVGHILPAKVITRLVYPPGLEYLSDFALNEFLNSNPLPFYINLLLAIAYGTIFFLIGRFLFYKNKKA